MNADAIIKVLDEVTARISGPAEKMWAIYIKQMIAYGVADLIAGALMLGVVLAWVLFSRKSFKRDDGYCCEPFDGYFIVGGIVSVILVIWAVALIISGSLFLFSPEYYALDAIMGRMK